MQTTLKTWARVTAIAGSLIVGLAFLGSTSFSQELAAFEQPCEKFLSDKDLVDALIVQRTNQTTKPIYVAELVTTLSKLGFRDEVSTWLASMSVGEFDRFDNRKVTSDLLDAAEKGDFDRVNNIVATIPDEHQRHQVSSFILPLVFASYERFEELMNMYPLGDGVYSQNLAADRGIKLLLRAERYQQAIELYYKHQFGYHIGEMLDPLAAGLWQAKRLDLLYKVLDDEYVRADEYRYTGAYICCMEGGASGGLPAGEEICRKKKKKSYRHRALELFDSNAYVNCMFIKDKKTKDLCLDELERRYRASGKELTEEQLVEDMYSYSAVLVLLRYWGMMGDPRPDLIPSQTFVNSDFKDVRAIAGVIAGLPLIEEREAAMNLLDKAIEAKLESLKEKKTGIAGALSNISNNAGADFEQWATYAFFDAVKQLNDADGLGEVITDSPKEVVDYFALENARLKLLIEEDRSQEVLSFLKRIPRSSKSHPGSITPSSLLRLASLATMKKNDELATDLYKLSEQAYCELPLDDKETSNLHYLKKHLVFIGVRDGLLPSWASHDLRH